MYRINRHIIKLQLIIALIVFCKYQANAQYIPSFTQFYLQDYYYNSSLFGSEDNNLGINLIHTQWMNSNFNAGPNTQNLGIDKSWGGDEFKFGLGGQIIRDNQGQAFQTSSYGGGVSFSFGKTHSIGFGLATYYRQNVFNPSSFENMETGDLIIESGRLNSATLNPSFGMNYKFNNPRKFSLQFGFSSTNLYDFINKPQVNSPLESFLNEFNGLLKMRFVISPDRNLNFISLYRGNGGFGIAYNGWSNNLLPNSMSNIVLYNSSIGNNKFGLGLGYNAHFFEGNSIMSNSFSPLLMFNHKGLKIGLAYDYSLTTLQQYSNGTFEVSLSYLIPEKSKTLNSENENDEIEEVEEKKKKSKAKVKGDKKRFYMNELMINTDFSFKSHDNEIIMINFQVINNNLVVTNYTDDEDYYDFADFFIGDYETGSFKININSNTEKDLQYDISILIKSDDESTVLKSALLKSFSSNENTPIKLKLPYGFRETDIYFISISCSEKSKNKIYKSSSLDIKFKLNND